MAKTNTKGKSRPAITPEARLNQLVSKAYDLVEKRLDDGTASASETTQLLKYGSEKARLEQEKLRRENELLIAKAEALQSAKNVEELYSEALKAMRTYSGLSKEDDDVY